MTLLVDIANILHESSESVQCKTQPTLGFQFLSLTEKKYLGLHNILLILKKNFVVFLS